jgi:uncharacterized protein YggE
MAAIPALLVLCPSPLRAQGSGAERPRITVSGEAVVQVRPDRAVVSASVETMDLDVGVAKQRNAEISRKVLAAARECGAADKEIQTDYLSVDQRWDDYYKRQRLLGYVVRNHLAITLSDTSRLEELTDRLLAAGAVSLGGVDFQTSELRTHRDRAREMALRAAKEKAERMAAVLGENLGPVLQITESPLPVPSWYRAGPSQNVTQNVAMNSSAPSGGAGEGSESVALGKIAIRAGVSVTFELKR